MTQETAVRQQTAPTRADISFADAKIAQTVFGQYDQNLILIENRMGATISARGTNIVIEGDAAAAVEVVLHALYREARSRHEITPGLIEMHIREAGAGQTRNIRAEVVGNVIPQVSIRTRKKTIVPRTPAQAHYIMAMQRDEMVFGLGPAGTGKTYVAVAQAVSCLMDGSVQKLILSRPAIEAGEKLGFLPGDMKEKVDPFLRPIYDALYDCLPAEQVERRIASGEIEIAPIAFMRGRTLSNAFIILDEAQNTTPSQMKMFLTRFGEGSKMVICGDPNQTDLPGGPEKSGLADAVAKLEGTEGIRFARFGIGDVVRHQLVGRIVQAYEG